MKRAYRFPRASDLDRWQDSSRMVRQRVTVPVFINKIFCGRLAERAEPLRAPRRHQDEVSAGPRVPQSAEPINAAAFEHDEAMLHHVHLDHAERGPGLIDHRVYRKVETHFLWKEALHLQAGIVLEWMRSHGIFVRNDQTRRFDGGNRLIEFFNYRNPAALSSLQAMLQSFGKKGVSASPQFAAFTVNLQLQAAVNHKDEALSGGAAQFSSVFKFRGVLRELGA